jgi:RNA polymerase sigma-54 factor
LEPRGVGARDAREALLLQLDPRCADYPLLARLVEDCLDDLANGKRAKVARALGIDAELLEELLAHLATLRLDLDADDGPQAAVVLPELVVEPTLEGGFELQLVDGALPGVSVDPHLSRLAEVRRDDARVRRFLATQLKETRDLAAAIESRRRTLLAVAREVFLRQQRFLVEGLAALAPLSMGEVAEILGIALSTVSRAVAGKHVQTPFGILPLRRFFQAAAGGDASKARESLGGALQALVAGEDPRQPLSDEELVERLKAKGYAAARRTVARWREELGIPSSYRRKR